MRNGRLWPMSGGSTIGGKSGDKVWVRSTRCTPPASAMVRSCAVRPLGFFGRARVFATAVLRRTFFRATAFFALFIVRPHRLRVRAPLDYRDAAPPKPAPRHPDRHPRPSL